MRRRGALAGLLLALACVLVVGAFRLNAATSSRADDWRTIQSQGQEWRYLLHHPAQLGAARPIPLVIALHGAPDTPDAMAARTRFDALADRAGFLVVYPNFPLTPGKEDGGLTKMQVVADIIDALEGGGGVDPGHVFITGFSGGAVLSYRMACYYADKVAAIASVSGLMIRPDCPVSRPVSIYEIHGTRDGSIPYNGGPYTKPVRETIDHWLQFDHCSGDPTTSTIGPVMRQTWSDCADGVVVQFDTIAGGVHAWPGDPRFPGSSPDGQFDATPAIWSFFLAHGRSTPVAPALLRVGVTRTAGKRVLVVGVRGAAGQTVTVSLLRTGKTVASTRKVLAAPGDETLRLTLSKSVAPGPYKVRVAIGETMSTRAVTVR